MSDEYRWYLLAKKKSEKLIIEAFRALRARGIEPILIKGWAAARNYPAGKTRFFGDVDLAVSTSDYPAAIEMVNDPASGVTGVDLHRELRHLDTLDWDRLFADSELVDVDGNLVRVLSAEDHLRVLCAHWLTNGGETKERLWDIVYAVRHRPDDFDWARCLDAVPANRRSWVIVTIALAHRYLGLELDGLPFASEAGTVPEWLIRSVERSWANPVKLRGIDESITRPSMVLTQVKKRLPPNPIQSTIFCEGSFDNRSPIRYQLRDFAARTAPSIRRIAKAIVNQYRWSKSK